MGFGLRFIFKVTFVLLVFNSLAGSRSLFDKNDTNSTKNLRSFAAGFFSNEIVDPDVDWPVYMAMLETEQIQAAFVGCGHLGSAFAPPGWAVPSGWIDYSFVSPYGSNNGYLFGGALWVGGIVGQDTLVSVGMDGWAFVNEMWPGGNPPGPAVTKLDGFADVSYRAQFYDTLTDPNYVNTDNFDGRPHIPLNLKIANRAHVWRSAPYDMAIIYDMVITNIGDQNVSDGYVGFYVDPDIYHAGGSNNLGYNDDISGAVKSKGIAYTIDNDGDPDSTGVFTATSPIRSFAFKFLRTSFEPADTNFNWWHSNQSPDTDFGPRMKPTAEDPWRDFGGFIGTPMGDNNKYYVMSHNEWDYDQIMTATITDSDPVWMQPPYYSQAVGFADGYDSRFLFSIGSFNLAPDSSVRILYAVFTPDSIHTDPDNFANNFDPDFPEIYYLNLNLDRLIETGDTAAAMAEWLFDPELPVTGLGVAYADADSVIIEWDPYIFPEVEGYDIYVTEYNQGDWPYPGVMPPWFKPDAIEYYTGTGQTGRYTFHSLQPHKAYYINVANRMGGITGNPGCPILALTSDYSQAPGIKEEFVFGYVNGSATFEWSAPDNVNIDHYNIYRFPTSDSAAKRYQAFYDDFLKADINSVDSFNIEGKMYYYYKMMPTAQVDSGITTYTDNQAEDSNVYVITAVNKLGFESEFSDEITFNVIPARTKEILVVISKISKAADYVYYDTIAAFYDSILQGYDYDLYCLQDSMKPTVCTSSPPGLCIDWIDFMPYKVVILEDGIFDNGQLERHEILEKGLTRYALSGGVVCYFGMPLPYLGITVLYDFGPEYYPLSHPFMSRFFGIDSIMAVGLNYYFSNSTFPYIDSVFGFVWAEGITADIPDVEYDLSRWPFDSNLLVFWPNNTAPLAASFRTNSSGEIIQRYRSLYPASSMQENDPVGILTETENTRTYIFGYHLWYMQHEDAKALIDYIYSGIQTDIANNDNSMLPRQFKLHQNYPNPFNMTTSISFALPEKADVTLDIYNILGQKIRTLLNETLAAGVHTATWDGRDDYGREVASGIYFYRIAAGEYLMSKKMLLLK